MRVWYVAGLTGMLCVVAGCSKARERPPAPAHADAGAESAGACEECGPEEFCNYARMTRGQGCQATGVCQPRPSHCADDSKSPVCSCEHRTYESECDAHAAGASVMHHGPCTVSECEAIGGRVAVGPGSLPQCEDGEIDRGWLMQDGGGLSVEGALCCLPQGAAEQAHSAEKRGASCGATDAECGPEQFCNHAGVLDGQGCGEATGVCQTLPSGCIGNALYAVCGCDRFTYADVCEARAAGSSVLHEGACTVSDCEAIGGRVQLPPFDGPCKQHETFHGFLTRDGEERSERGAACCLP